MRLLFNTYSSNEFADACEFATVEMTPELAETILHRAESFRKLHETEPSLMELQYYDCAVEFLSGLPPDENGDEVDGVRDAADWQIWNGITVESLEPLIERTECDRMVITDRDVYWWAHPKHCDWFVETRPINLDQLRGLLAGSVAPCR
jgi:hypothetical protein